MTIVTTYEGLLEEVASHANDGSLGCFVVVDPSEHGEISIRLFDRWFDGDQIDTKCLARRRVDAMAAGGVAAAAAIAEELREQAARRDAEHEAELVSTGELSVRGASARTRSLVKLPNLPTSSTRSIKHPDRRHPRVSGDLVQVPPGARLLRE